MTTIEGRGEWLALLEAEQARRKAHVEWEADETERAGRQFIAALEQMAERYAATAHLYPLPVDDMSPAEKLACRWFLPDELQPAGQPTEEAIWAEAQARRGDRRTPGVAV